MLLGGSKFQWIFKIYLVVIVSCVKWHFSIFFNE